MSAVISPFSRYLLELRLGRVNALMDMLDKNPGAINQKVKSSATTSESFLEMATRFDQTNAVLLLKNRGAVETPSTAPSLLARAVINKNDQLVHLFSNWGWDPWDGCETEALAPPICTAVNLNYKNALDLWTSMGVGFTKSTSSGHNLLHILMSFFSIQEMKDPQKDLAVALMKKGVSWVAPDNEGATPQSMCTNGKNAAVLNDEWEKVCAARSKKSLLKALSESSEDGAAKKRRM